MSTHVRFMSDSQDSRPGLTVCCTPPWHALFAYQTSKLHLPIQHVAPSMWLKAIMAALQVLHQMPQSSEDACLTQAGPFDPKGNLAPIAELPPPAEGQKAGDYIIMRAEMNCVCVMSACPADDITEINGEGGTQAVHYEILELS